MVRISVLKFAEKGAFQGIFRMSLISEKKGVFSEQKNRENQKNYHLSHPITIFG